MPVLRLGWRWRPRCRGRCPRQRAAHGTPEDGRGGTQRRDDDDECPCPCREAAWRPCGGRSGHEVEHLVRQSRRRQRGPGRRKRSDFGSSIMMGEKCLGGGKAIAAPNESRNANARRGRTVVVRAGDCKKRLGCGTPIPRGATRVRNRPTQSAPIVYGVRQAH